MRISDWSSDVCSSDLDPYPVENFGNSRGGTGTITQQTLRSSNCAYVRLGQIVGIDKVVTQAKRMGITTDLDEVVSMPLRTKEGYPLDMAGACASLPTDGEHNPPHHTDPVEDSQGSPIFPPTPHPPHAPACRTSRGRTECVI